MYLLHVLMELNDEDIHVSVYVCVLYRQIIIWKRVRCRNNRFTSEAAVLFSKCLVVNESLKVLKVGVALL